MKKITNIRKAVCTIANQLRKSGLSLSASFKAAWRKVKMSLRVRAAGVTFSNIQERLQFLTQFRKEDLTVTLEREKDNKHDSNAIQIVVHIKPIHRRAVVGYIPAAVARELAKVLDMGIQVKASLMGIIGGYAYKESYGALINIEI